MSVTDSVLKMNNGVSIPMLGLGTWLSKPGEVEKAVEFALKAGYRHLDCAAMYGNEVEVGAGIKSSGVPREEIFVTSKLWNTKHHLEDIEGACRKTLADLGLTYLDLYLIHGPIAFARGDAPWPMDSDGNMRLDTTVSPTETYLGMEKLVKLGLVRSIGVSNFNTVQIADILAKCSIKPVTNQVECHPYLNVAKLKEFCEARDIPLTAYSPLGCPDRPWAKPDDVQLLEDPKLKTIGAKYNKSPAQVLLRWSLQRGVIVIPKSVTPSRIEENAAVFDFALTEEEMATINSFDCNGRIIDWGPSCAAHQDYPFNEKL